MPRVPAQFLTLSRCCRQVSFLALASSSASLAVTSKATSAQEQKAAPSADVQEADFEKAIAVMQAYRQRNPEQYRDRLSALGSAARHSDFSTRWSGVRVGPASSERVIGAGSGLTIALTEQPAATKPQPPPKIIGATSGRRKMTVEEYMAEQEKDALAAYILAKTADAVLPLWQEQYGFSEDRTEEGAG